MHAFIAIFFSIFSFLSVHSPGTVSGNTFVSPLPLTHSAIEKNIQPQKGLSLTEKSENTRLLPIHILLLGLDARKGDSHPRCDAIHILSLFPDLGTVQITSVPRGTSINLAGLDRESSYIGNACHILGIEKTIPLIEKIAGIHPDYTVKVGFSQTMGILRTLHLPTTDTLQFLRNRKYAIGDHQRSHNQAVFIKDVLVARLDHITLFPKPLFYLLYKTIDTDLDFETAYSYLIALKELQTYKKPGGVTLITKPDGTVGVREIHSNFALPNSSFPSDEEFVTYQTNLNTSINKTLTDAKKDIAANNLPHAYKTIETPFTQKIWLQIDDDKKRNDAYFKFVTVFAKSTSDRKKASSEVLDFITSMEQLHEDQFQQQGETLLAEITQE